MNDDFDLDDFYHNNLKLCVCYQPWAAILLIRDILNNYRIHKIILENIIKEGIIIDDEKLKEESKRFNDELHRLMPHDGLKQIVLSLLNDANCLEHGGNIVFGWLDKTGDRFLDLFEKYEEEDLEKHFLRGKENG